MWSLQLLLLVRFMRKLPLAPSVSILLPVLFPVLLRVLLQVLGSLRLRPPLRTLTSVVSTATTEIKLSIATTPELPFLCSLRLLLLPWLRP